MKQKKFSGTYLIPFDRPLTNELEYPVVIPAFNENGYLPEGVHDCTSEETTARFGTFQLSDRRPRLWAYFAEFIAEAKRSGLIQALVLDGSFVTANAYPNDIDLIVVVPANHDFFTELQLLQYNLISQRRVRRRFGFDIVVVRDGSENLERAIEFFQQVKQRPGEKKGLLRITV